MHLRTSSRRVAVLAAAVCYLTPTAIAAADLKIGLVDQRRGVLSTEEGKAAQAKLEAMVEKRRGEIEPRQKELLSAKDELESQRFVLSKDAFEERALEWEKSKREIERDASAIQDELAIEERKMLRPIVEQWEAAVKEIGEEKGFDLILERSMPGILYQKDAHDITDLVVQRMNKNKGKAPAAAQAD